jgi:hypothetical protein
MLPQPDTAITIHGVGQHESEQVARELSKGFGGLVPFKIIDFNWCGVVESDDRNRIAELSRSIAMANSHSNHRSSLFTFLVTITELLWGGAFLVVAFSPLLLAPTAALYGYLAGFRSLGPAFLIRC